MYVQIYEKDKIINRVHFCIKNQYKRIHVCQTSTVIIQFHSVLIVLIKKIFYRDMKEKLKFKHKNAIL